MKYCLCFLLIAFISCSRDDQTIKIKGSDTEVNLAVQLTESFLKLDDLDIYDKKNSVTNIRKRIGMVFQKPNPLPKSICENLSYAMNIHEFPKDEVP